MLSQYGTVRHLLVGFAACGRSALRLLGFSRVGALAFILTLVGGGAPPGVAADVIAARNTPHLSFTASLSPDSIKSGGRLSLVVNVTPKKRMHVYAPGTHYRPVTVTLKKSAWLTPGRTVYPKASIYIFKPLQEQVLVYSDRFTLTTTVAVGTIPPKLTQVTIAGTLSYQACDDRVCYLPQSVPLEWVLPVRR